MTGGAESGTSLQEEKQQSDRRMTIGAFSKRSRLSMKALRLYERQGLLVPAEIDATNGYRWYRESQVQLARLIVLLRRLDMPLSEVATVIKALDLSEIQGSWVSHGPAIHGEAAARMIAAYWERVDARISAQRELVSHLVGRLGGTTEFGRRFEMVEVFERDVPEQTVVTEQRHIRVPEIQDWIGAAMNRLFPIAERLGGVTGAAFVIYHGEVSEESDGPVEVCIPIASPSDPAAAADAPIRIEPAHREAYTRIKKVQVQFPQILSAYDAVSAWMAEHGKTMTASPREVYFADFDAAGPNDEVCDVAYPIA